jgi:hypothetical protein
MLQRACRTVVGIGLVLSAMLLMAPVRAQASGQLQVSSQPPLYPGFDTGIHYYVTRCANNPLQVTVTVPAATVVSVDGQPPQAGTTFSTQVPLTEGQEFLIEWTANNTTQTYHVRCLPADFPDWTSTQSAGQAQMAYVVVTPNLASNLSGPAVPYVAVFDTNGVPRWWLKEAPAPIDAKTVANGDLAWTQFANGAPYEEHALDGSLVRTYQPSGSAPTDDHELQILANGDYFLAVDTQRTLDVSGCGGSTSATVTDQVIQELSNAGTLLWSWDTADHIPISEVPPGFYSACMSGDPYHFNSIQVDTDGNLVVSYRNLDALYKIDVSTNAIVWKAGGVPTSASLTISGDPDCSPSSCQDFGGQHDARVFTDTSTGKAFLTLHDNGTDRNRPPRALRITIDTASRTATLAETVSDSNVTQSICCGSARKLTGGDWLVDWGGTPNVEELPATSSGGNAVFSLTFSSVFSYRAQPITAVEYGDALTAGMNAQHPRTAQDGGPPSNVPEAPAVPLIAVAGAAALGVVLLRTRKATRR